MSRGNTFGYSLEDAFGVKPVSQTLSQVNSVTVIDAKTTVTPEQTPDAPPKKRGHASRRHGRQRRSHRRGRRSRRAASTSSESSVYTSSSDESSDSDSDDDDDGAIAAIPVASSSASAEAVYVPTTRDEPSAFRIFAGGFDASSWSLPPSVVAASLGPEGPGVPESPWPGPYQGGPKPSLHMQDSRLVNGGQVFGAELAGSFTDPNTGIVYAAYTDRMPEPKVLRDVPDLELGKPNRMLEALTGVSAVQRPCRQEIVNDFQDAMEGLQIPQGILEMQIRNETAQREAREVFFTNREVEQGHNDTHWDGYIGTTYVLRPTYDTQTLRDNSETNTTELQFHQNADGNLAVPMFRAPTEFGGAMQPTVDILANDKAYGLPHLHSEFQVDNARFQALPDTARPRLEKVNSGYRATIGAAGGLPWESTHLPSVSDGLAIDKTFTGAGHLTPLHQLVATLSLPGPRQDSGYAADAQISSAQAHAVDLGPTLNLSNLLAATAGAVTKDAQVSNYFNRMGAETGGLPATNMPSIRDSGNGVDSGVVLRGSTIAPDVEFGGSRVAASSDYAGARDAELAAQGGRQFTAAPDGAGAPVFLQDSRHAARDAQTALMRHDAANMPASSTLQGVYDADGAGRDATVQTQTRAVSLEAVEGTSAAMARVDTRAGKDAQVSTYVPSVIAPQAAGTWIKAADSLQARDARVADNIRGDTAYAGSTSLLPALSSAARDSSVLANIIRANSSDVAAASTASLPTQFNSMAASSERVNTASVRNGGSDVPAMTASLPSAVGSERAVTDSAVLPGRAAGSIDVQTSSQGAMQPGAYSSFAGDSRVGVLPSTQILAAGTQQTLQSVPSSSNGNDSRTTATAHGMGLSRDTSNAAVTGLRAVVNDAAFAKDASAGAALRTAPEGAGDFATALPQPTINSYAGDARVGITARGGALVADTATPESFPALSDALYLGSESSSIGTARTVAQADDSGNFSTATQPAPVLQYVGDESKRIGNARAVAQADDSGNFSTATQLAAVSQYVGNESTRIGNARSVAQADDSGNFSTATQLAAVSQYVGNESTRIGNARSVAQADDSGNFSTGTQLAAVSQYVGNESTRIGSTRLVAEAGSDAFSAPGLVSQYARDSGVGALRAEILQNSFAESAMIPVVVSDSSYTETQMVPGRVSNSKVFSWTGQSIVAEAMPMYTQDPDKGDAMHAQDKYTTHERVIRETLAQTQIGASAAGFRNEYATSGRRKDETDVWKGRKGGPSSRIINALLENQLYKYSTRPQEDDNMEATRVAYESDVG